MAGWKDPRSLNGGFQSLGKSPILDGPFSSQPCWMTPEGKKRLSWIFLAARGHQGLVSQWWQVSQVTRACSRGSHEALRVPIAIFPC